MKKPGIQDAQKICRQYWGFDHFREGQQEAIESVISGRDTIVLFPTGGGKSLCYQVPALLFKGLTIVISPLIALMEDQVNQLSDRGISSAYINSTLSGREIEQRFVNARNGMYKMLYISPERLATDIWKREAENLNIALVAVDEAHCISEWGHDFRPSYRNIRDELDSVPGDPAWMALTATATPEVRKDILSALKFQNPKIVTGSFKRENLVWWVNQTERKNKEVLRAVRKAVGLGSGIIYSSTRRNCELWSDQLSYAGIECLPYHAGLKSHTRSAVQQKWVSGEVPLVAATSAFGMGIDKPDCRFVIHETIPFSLEAYYQEAGRAGRDGKEAYPLLIYKPGDIQILQSRIERSYPTVERLEGVYQALCDELNLAGGSLQEEAQIVSFKNVSVRADIPESVVRLSVELFRRLGILEFMELKEPRVGVRFLVSQEYLMQFIDEAPVRKGEFLDLLMRQFDNRAFHNTQFVKESVLLDRLHITAHQLEKALHVFAAHDHILSQVYDKENTLILLNEPRMQRFHIDKKAAYFYKKVLTDKLHYIQRYAETSECREVYLRNYFGETGCKPCGKCDNCTKKPSERIVVEKGDIPHILSIMEQKQSIPFHEIEKASGWSRSKTMHVIRFMCREEILQVVNKKGTDYFQLSGA